MEREKTREALTNLSNLYTAPSSDNAAPKLHPYSLRGVSTNHSTMYICERAEPDLMDMNLDSSQTTSNNDQWWRIHYSASGTASWDQSGIPGGKNPVTVEVCLLPMLLSVLLFRGVICLTSFAENNGREGS